MFVEKANQIEALVPKRNRVSFFFFSFSSSYCNACVARFDHHCPYVSQCIGYYNHRLFFLFLVSATIGVAGGVILCTVSLYDFLTITAAADSSWFGAIWGWGEAEPFMATMFPIFVTYFLFLWSLTFPQLNQAAWNITTNEFNNRDRYRYVEHPGYTPWTGNGYRDFANNMWELITNPRKIDWLNYYEIKKEV